jgi:phage terminase large subunit-like protein
MLLRSVAKVELIYSCPKKSGKTTFAAIFVITILVLFGGAHPEAICAANDRQQAVGRVFEVIKQIVECSPLLRTRAKITAEKITLADGAIIRAIPNNYASAAGSNHVIAVFDELWAFDSEDSRRLFDELVPPPTRPIACRLTVTYAGFSGESSLLEELYERGLKQRQVATDLYAGDGMLMFWSHEPVAPWQNADWLAEMRRSFRPHQYRRVIENRFVNAKSKFIDMKLWDACTNECFHPLFDYHPRVPIWVGVDASTKHDSTALAAVSFLKREQKVWLIDHRIFTPSSHEPIDFTADVEQTLHDWCSRFDVRAIWFDPYQMAASAQRLVRDGLPMEEYTPTVNNLTAIAENLLRLVKGGNLLVYPDAEIREAVSGTIAIEGARGWKIARDKQSHQIDIVIAIGLAALACVKAQGESSSSPWTQKQVDNYGNFLSGLMFSGVRF